MKALDKEKYKSNGKITLDIWLAISRMIPWEGPLLKIFNNIMNF